MTSRTDARLLKTTKFPPEFSKKVDMQKVNIDVMKKWIASRISEILGNEDDVVIELCFNLIDGPRYPDIKALQIQLTGFLDKDTAAFCKQLWKLFLSAQESPQGVPKELLEAKKLELMQEKGKAAEIVRKRRQDIDRCDRNITSPNDRRDGPRDNRQGRRSDRGIDSRGLNSRPSRRSPSPDGRRRGNRSSFRGDSYVPRERDGAPQGRGRHRRRQRSPSTSSSRRSDSGSRSPQQRRDSSRHQIKSRRRSRSRSFSPRRDSGRYERRRERSRSPVTKRTRRDSRSPSRSRGRSSSASTPSSRSRSYSSSESKSRSCKRNRRRSRSRSNSPR